MKHDRCCGDCLHYEPARNPDTGRVLPSHPGNCGFVVVLPALPIAYTLYGPVRRLEKNHVRKGTSAAGCPCYSAKDMPQPKRQADPQLGLQTKETPR